MEPVYIMALAGAFCGIVLTVIVVLARWGAQGKLAASEASAKASTLEGELSQLRDAKFEVECRMAVEEQKASRVPGLEAELREKSCQTDGLHAAKAAAERELAATKAKLEETLAARAEAATQAETALQHLRSSLDAARKELADLQASEARLKETLDLERKHSEAKLSLLAEAREQMSKEFKLLAEDVMRTHGDTFSRQNKEQLEGVLGPLRERLTEFQQGLQNAHLESAKDRASLSEHIRNLTAESARMTSETHNLTQALKSKGQTQGAWGEMILATILERSGLREGEEFTTQESHSIDNGGRLRPDVVVNLPGGQRIIVDSKVSLTAFEAYVNAEAEGMRSVQLRAHVASLRTHIKALAGKEYHALTENGLDYVIMFVPIEGALAAALQEDPALTAYAAENNVAIATPTTLMIALRTVANVWQVERRNRNAEAIAKRAGAIYDKFAGFLGDMEAMGTRLKQAAESYEGAMNKLKTGRGNILAQVEQLKEMGAKTSKSLPQAIVDEAPEALAAPDAAAA